MKKEKKQLKNQADISGVMGDRVTVRKVNGRMVVTNRPVRKKGKPSAKLKAQRENFQSAAKYAKVQQESEERSALYSKAIKNKHESVYSVALKDYMNPPKVELINASFYHGRIGDIIEIQASDDFMVTRVVVIINGADGVLIEQGDATENKNVVDRWEYKAGVANPVRAGTTITVKAEDMPGHWGNGEVVL